MLDLHNEYVERGGRFFACPVGVKTRNLEGAELVEGAEVKGAASLHEFTGGGALTFNYLTTPGSSAPDLASCSGHTCQRWPVVAGPLQNGQDGRAQQDVQV